jgi:hypothetical protein
MPSVSTPTPAVERIAAAQPIQQGHPDYFDKIMSRFGHHLSHQQQSTLTQNLVPVLQTSRQGGIDNNKPVEDLSRTGGTSIPSSTFTDSEEEKRKNAQERQRRQLAAAAMAAAANGDTTAK